MIALFACSALNVVERKCPEGNEVVSPGDRIAGDRLKVTPEDFALGRHPIVRKVKNKTVTRSYYIYH